MMKYYIAFAFGVIIASIVIFYKTDNFLKSGRISALSGEYICVLERKGE